MIIVKIGGGAEINLKGIIEDLADLKEKSIIVHGANALRDKLLSDLGLEKKVLTSISGYSSVFTDEKALDILIMAYAGLRNKRIVELCQQNGINAIGLSGIDGKMVQGRRNLGIKIEQDGKKKIVRDLSGKPRIINRELIELLLHHNYTPVLCVPILDELNSAINSENDDIINVLQHTVHATRIIQLIEAPGFLKDHQDHNSLILKMAQNELESWEAKVSGRIKRKLLALKKLFENGVGTVIISDGRVEHPLRDALNGKGTIIQ